MEYNHNGKESVKVRQDNAFRELKINPEELDRRNYSARAFAYARAGDLLKKKGDHLAAGRSYLHAARYGRDAKFIKGSPGGAPNDETIAEWREEGDRELFRSGSFIDKDGLSRRLLVSVALIGLLGTTAFLFQNFTGNVIGANSNSNVFGAIFFVIGITGAFLYFRKR